MNRYGVTVNGILIGYVKGESEEDVYWIIVHADITGARVPTVTGYVKVKMESVAVIQIVLEGN